MESTSRTTQNEPEAPPAAGGGGGVAALFWLTAVQALLVFTQAALAGQFLNGNPAALDLHEQNAGIIPLLGIAQLVVALRVWRRRGVAWPAVAAGVLLVAVLLQITFGYARLLAFHVPLGVAIFGTSLWLLIGTRRLRRA